MNKTVIREFFKSRIFKGIIKVLAFLLVFAILLEILSFTAFSKQSGTTYKNRFSDAYSFTNEPEETIQVAAIGNSDLYSSFVPTTLWDEFGYTSTVIAAPRFTTLNAYQLFSELLKTQTPELVFNETDMLYKDEPLSAEEINKKYRKTFVQIKMNQFFESLDSDRFEVALEDHYTIFTFHDKWKGKKQYGSGDNAHGYKFNTDIVEVQKIDYMGSFTDKEELDPNELKNVEKMIDLCQSKGIKFVFVEVPTVNSWNMQRHNAIVELAEKYNTDFIDCNVIMDELGINFKKDFRDMGNHLNYDGANKVTKYIGNYIRDNHELECRSENPDYKYWHESSENFKKENEIIA